MDLGLNGKSVLVTGASGGIGSQVALQFAEEGANVAVHYHNNRESAEAIAKQIGEENSLVAGGDLRNESAVRQIFAAVTDRFGRVDILVANAGVWPVQHDAIADMDLQRWKQTLETNLTSVFLCCRQFISQLRQHPVAQPAIVMIGSTAGLFGEAGHGDYAATKSAIAYGMMLSMKNEIVAVAPRGRINTVCPGWTVTPMAERFVDNPDAVKTALTTIPLRKVAAPRDIANAVLFLSSSQVAGHITGQILTVSGGMEGRKLNDEDSLDVSKALP